MSDEKQVKIFVEVMKKYSGKSYTVEDVKNIFNMVEKVIPLALIAFKCESCRNKYNEQHANKNNS